MSKTSIRVMRRRIGARQLREQAIAIGDGDFDKGRQRLGEELEAILSEDYHGKDPQDWRIRPDQFKIHELAEIFLPGWREMREDQGRGGLVGVRESGGAVDSTAFNNITGQIIYGEVFQGYRLDGFIGDRLVTERQSSLEQEKVPGFTTIGAEGDVEEVREGMAFPSVGMGEDYHETMPTKKYGLVIKLTKEAIFYDRTGQILDNARKVGERVGQKKEDRILDVVLGIVQAYTWRGTLYSTYLTSGGWINAQTGNELVDWTDIEAADRLFDDITDPDTGDRLDFMPNQLLVMPAKLFTAKRIVNATEVRDTNGTGTEVISPNPVAGMNLEILTSRRAYGKVFAASGLGNGNAAASGKFWWYGDFKKAFGYITNWPLTVRSAPANNPEEFYRDVVMAWRADEKGAAYVRNPRHVVRNAG